MKNILKMKILIFFISIQNICFSQVNFTPSGLDFLKSGSRKATIGVDLNTFRITSEDVSQDLSIQTGGFNERIRITANGNIGVGVFPLNNFRFIIAGNSTIQPFGIFDDKSGLSNSDFWNNSTSSSAGVGLRLVTNRPNTTFQNVASIEKQRNGLLSLKNYDSNASFEIDLQNNGSTAPEFVIANDGGIKIPAAGIKFGGTPETGFINIRGTGSDLQGYIANQWISLINKPPQSFWATASPEANCSNVCPNGYAPAADVNGKTCKNLRNTASNAVSFDMYYRYEGSVRYGDLFWGCGSNYGTTDYYLRLAQCHCVRVN